jgi:hypothetical protein
LSSLIDVLNKKKFSKNADKLNFSHETNLRSQIKNTKSLATAKQPQKYFINF